MKKHVTLTALTLVTVLGASSAMAGGITVAEKDDTKLKLSGKAFLGFTHNDKAGDKTIGGNVDRFYLQAEYYTGIWKARITTDVNNETGNTIAKDSTGASLNKGLKRNMNVFLKYAFLEGHFSDAAQLRLGLSHTPWIDYEQGLWKHRYVSKVTSDHFGFDNSADYGVGLKGKLADGMVKYWVTETNGGGYGNPNQTRALDFDSRVSIAPIDGLDVSLQYRSGYKGKKVKGANLPDKDVMTQLMASYGNKEYRVGFNTIKVSNFKATTGDDRTANALWGWTKFNKEFGAFAKIEKMKHTGTVSNGNGEKKDHQVIGIDYAADKNVTLTFAYDTEKHTLASGTATTNK